MGQMVKHNGYWCEKVASGWKVRVSEFASGQRETLITRRFEYHVGTEFFEDGSALVEEVDQSGTLLQAERDAQRAEVLAWKAGQRAKRNCRGKIKEAGFDELLTITYRQNQCDLALCRKHFAAWLRKMRKALPGFRGVWAFERQKRGAWHVHVCCDRLPVLMHFRGARVKSWKVGTALWRDVVGPNNGLCFVGGKDGRFNRYRSCAKMAGYVSKYLTKHHEDGVKDARMWDSTRGLTPKKPKVFEFQECPLGELIGAVWELPVGHVVANHICTRENSMWLMYSEPDPLVKRPIEAASGI